MVPDRFLYRSTDYENVIGIFSKRYFWSPVCTAFKDELDRLV